jgi:hypothetical protein
VAKDVSSHLPKNTIFEQRNSLSRYWRAAGLALLCSLALTPCLRAQEPETPPPTPSQEVPLPTLEQAQKNPQGNCVEPPPMVRWQDYQGPFSKTVGTFAGRLERKSVRAPQFKAGSVLCSFTPKRKFILFAQDMVDPLTFIGAVFNAGVDEAEDSDPSFGHDFAGYAKRFGAELADDATSEFFKDFAYPTIFSEDPRYYRLGHGRPGVRLVHALAHVVVAHQENGRHMFNFSEWLGTTSSVALGDTYHPDNRPGIGPAATSVGFAVLQDMGYDVLREFWPEIARKLKLPFRDQNEPQN